MLSESECMCLCFYYILNEYFYQSLSREPWLKSEKYEGDTFSAEDRVSRKEKRVEMAT